MPKLECTCGFVHDLTPTPDEGWITVPDKDYDALIKDEIASAQGDEEAEDRVVNYWGSLYECPRCGRIMWRKPSDDSFTVYRKDENA